MKLKMPFKNTPDERIRVIECSLRCLGFGGASAVTMLAAPLDVLLIANLPHSARNAAVFGTLWIPLLGFIFSSIAWKNVLEAHRASHGEWNPARAQLIWGRFFSASGILISLLLLFFFSCVLFGLTE
jgi:hypothetical protein